MAQPSLLSGLSAFPLTPLSDDHIDGAAYARLVRLLADAGVDSITALGSTGSYAYLTREERQIVARIAVENAGATPVFVGIGALRTSYVLALVEDAQQAGASGLLLAPVSYQALTEDDVYGLFEAVSRSCSVPLILYDNPGTTHFKFNDALYARIAALPNLASIKIPPVLGTQKEVATRVAAIRALVPPYVTIGISGDAYAATALNAGCDGWYSVIGGLLPEPALEITRAARRGNAAEALAASERLAPIWALFAKHGSLRVTAAIAEHLGLAPRNCLPLPIRGLSAADRAEVIVALGQVTA